MKAYTALYGLIFIELGHKIKTVLENITVLCYTNNKRTVGTNGRG